MKKFAIFLLMVAMALTVSACNPGGTNTGDLPNDDNQHEQNDPSSDNEPDTDVDPDQEDPSTDDEQDEEAKRLEELKQQKIKEATDFLSDLDNLNNFAAYWYKYSVLDKKYTFDLELNYMCVETLGIANPSEKNTVYISEENKEDFIYYYELAGTQKVWHKRALTEEETGFRESLSRFGELLEIQYEKFDENRNELQGTLNGEQVAVELKQEVLSFLYDKYILDIRDKNETITPELPTDYIDDTAKDEYENTIIWQDGKIVNYPKFVEALENAIKENDLITKAYSGVMSTLTDILYVNSQDLTFGALYNNKKGSTIFREFQLQDISAAQLTIGGMEKLYINNNKAVIGLGAPIGLAHNAFDNDAKQNLLAANALEIYAEKGVQPGSINAPKDPQPKYEDAKILWWGATARSSVGSASDMGSTTVTNYKLLVETKKDSIEMLDLAVSVAAKGSDYEYYLLNCDSEHVKVSTATMKEVDFENVELYRPTTVKMNVSYTPYIESKESHKMHASSPASF